MPPRRNATRGALPNSSTECSIAVFFWRLPSLKRCLFRRPTRTRTSIARLRRAEKLWLLSPDNKVVGSAGERELQATASCRGILQYHSGADSPARRRRYKNNGKREQLNYQLERECEFMPDELSELQENAEHGRENPSVAPVSVTMAILAVCVAIVSLLGHRSHTEELLMQNRATDQWAYYQAKNIRLHNYDMSLDMLPLIEFKDKEQAAKIRDKYQKEADRYTKEQADIEEQAKELEGESAGAQRKADRFDLGEVFLEIALVISSLALLSRKRFYWFLGIISGVAGLGVAVTGLMMH